jgi:hypothetical protein
VALPGETQLKNTYVTKHFWLISDPGSDQSLKKAENFPMQCANKDDLQSAYLPLAQQQQHKTSATLPKAATIPHIFCTPLND